MHDFFYVHNMNAFDVHIVNSVLKAIDSPYLVPLRHLF